ncbi:MAG TPA: iron-containing alcohol dehydrogenase [Puia sp.]|uniref:iron-containing alcohol dehydrogenase n=1 Tax=Puia sp. TaxID=2045100 RepID=UPI002CBE6386|nr:iron-containing alcohol dehydrogenase [Puia sp.]HVU98297.1 iron-containing alcohol dehydrogenase [Puia sp.]
MLRIHFPGKLVFGNHCIDELPGEVANLAPARVLILTITPLLAHLQPLFKALEQRNITIALYTSITQEPTFNDFHRVMSEATPFDPDLILGIGGGSVLDIAKLVAAQLGNAQCINHYVGIGLLKGRGRKLICIPTTSGTGSEVSPNAILVDNNDNQKKGIISPYLVPDIVYVDPLLTIGVPPAITAATGLDALTHCLEAYTNKFAQPFIDLYAFEGMRLIAENLVRAVRNGADEEARSQVAMGSLLGGFCLGPVNTAAVHALSYPLGSSFHLPHGLSNALLLPYVMEFNLPAARDRYTGVARALGVTTAEEGVKTIRQLIRDCGIPATLKEAAIPYDAIETMAADAMKITRLLNNNPRPVSKEDAIAIYQAAYE